jgi:esterase/lipase
MGAVRAVDEVRKASTGGDLGDPAARERNPCYTTLPVGGMAELARVVRWARRALPDVKVPVCTVHGARDRTIPPAASGIVAREVGSVWVERYVLPRSRHVIGLDVERDRVCQIVCSFVDEVLVREAA